METETIDLFTMPRCRDQVIVIDRKNILIHHCGRWHLMKAQPIETSRVPEFMNAFESTGFDVILAALVNPPTLILQMGLN